MHNNSFWCIYVYNIDRQSSSETSCRTYYPLCWRFDLHIFSTLQNGVEEKVDFMMDTYIHFNHRVLWRSYWYIYLVTFTLYGIGSFVLGGSKVSIHVFLVLCNLLSATKIAHLFALSYAVYCWTWKKSELQTMNHFHTISRCWILFKKIIGKYFREVVYK